MASEFADELKLLTEIIAALFGLGLISGLYRRLSRYLLFSDEERNKTLTMRASLMLALLGGLIAAAAAAWFLFDYCAPGRSCEPITATLWDSQPAPGLHLAATLYVDRLSAFFVLIIAGLSVGVSLYSFGWLAGDDQRNRVAGFYNLFVLALIVVAIADHIFFLILVLEVATLAFGYLILYKHNRQPEVETHQRAFSTYLIISQLSTALILAAFLILSYHAQKQICATATEACDAFSLSTFRGAMGNRLDLGGDPASATLVFLLAFGGLSIRAGAFPLHFWVSLAHPSSPTTTHAMSLGVGIKIALYLMLRMFFEFLHPAQAWWGWVVLLIGGATAAYNVFFAAIMHDLKRALAYHSVENIGIMLAGIGLALAAFGQASVIPIGLASIGLIAALFHLLNHAIFKSLLYLCTGIVEKRTHGMVEMRQLGGVWRYYPVTATAFLIGAFAIAGLPPFNGFISEWLTLAGLLGGLNPNGDTGLRAAELVAVLSGALMLAIALSLTAAAFVKIAGRSILGSPHEPEVWDTAERGDAPIHMIGVVSVLAALCLLLGLFPQPVVDLLNDITHDLLQTPSPLLPTPADLSFSLDNAFQARLPMLPIFTLAILLALAIGWVWIRSRHVRRGKVWAGGAVYQPARMQYTGAAFLYLLWSQFSRRERGKAAHTRRFDWPDYLYAQVEISARDRLTGPFRSVISGILYAVKTVSERVGNFVQGGDIRAYLLYILVAFLAALLVLVVRG
jgi:hydrogenase-4 component B